FLVLRMTESWLGREDIGLLNRLLGELPGILNWALEGLRWLVANGRFTEDPGAAEIVAQMTALASPMQSYVEEDCVVGKDLETNIQMLYYDHCAWRKANGHRAIASNTFGASLRAAFPHITAKKTRGPDGSQFRVYTGIRLRAPRDAFTELGSNVLPYRLRSQDPPED